MDYLLSDSFGGLAGKRTGKVDPTFIDMKSAFWLAEDLGSTCVGIKIQGFVFLCISGLRRAP